jgi:hypothetical protein
VDHSWNLSSSSVASSIESDQPGTGMHILTVKYVPGLDTRLRQDADQLGVFVLSYAGNKQ